MSATDENYTFFTDLPNVATMTFPGTPPSTYNISSVNRAVWGSRFRSGGVTPDFWIRRKYGGLFENNFTVSRFLINELQGHLYTESNLGVVVTLNGTTNSSFSLIPAVKTHGSILVQNLVNKVEQSVLEKVKQQSVNVAVAAAESGKSVAMIVTLLVRVMNAWKQARSGNFAGAALTLAGQTRGRGRLRRPKDAAKSWLELQYGWLPLLSDIYGLCKELQTKRGRGEFRVFKSKATMEDSTVEMYQPNSEYIDKRSFTTKATAIALVKCSRSDPQFQTMQAIGLTNPMLVLWELVPFSFVLDWAIPVTKFLGQFDSSVGWLYHSGSLTKITEASVDVERGSAKPAGYKRHEVSFNGRRSEFVFNRTNISSFVGHWTLPYAKNPVSTMHVANATALLLTLKR